MKKRTLLSSFLSLSLFSINVLATTQIEHHQGTQSFDAVPKKVITFDLSSLDTMDSLGLDVFGLPKEFANGHLEKFKDERYTNVGSLFEPDYEVVAASQPDLVIISGRASNAYDGLSDIAPTIDLTITGEDFLNQFKESSRKVAAIFDKESELESQLDQLDLKVNEIKSLAKTSGNALFILTNGGKISAYGSGSRFGWLHDDLGIEPVIKDIKAATHGDPVSFEFILETNPDWIFVLDRDSAIGRSQDAAKTLLDNELIHKTKASKNNQIVYLNGFNWYILAGGMTATMESVEEVLTALRK
ncbi:siderophore ABC transporter substrate-binding protein [Marinomonas algicola]|uniref:siderophore ABC transporter substrate-binding protein n=1 Tax=Marinomonas algicola TaxID=2773454 RepID=UPI00174DD5B7|nr:siderophore ABC transporter substrate-binding protein [Marinomonas algicola]